MQLHQLKEEAIKLSPRDRLSLVSAIVESLKDMPVSKPERAKAIQRLRGLLKTDQPAPSDREVTSMLEDRRVEKYQS